MINKTMDFDIYKMRLLESKDLDDYYEMAILGSDEEARYYTGSIDDEAKDPYKDIHLMRLEKKDFSSIL